MYRRDKKYDLLIPIKFNFKKPKKPWELYFYTFN